MIPEKIQSFRKILERNNLITVLCLLLVLVSFILNYLERRETLGKQLEFSYYVARSEERRVGKECRSRWSPYH